MSTLKTQDENEAIAHFKEYLRIPSVHPNVDYGDCVTFLRSRAASLGLPIEVIEVTSGKPVVIITWLGSQPELPSLLLNSHMDVVPVFAEKWKHDPFGAVTDAEGNIFARGSQDMKCVGIQYLEAVERLMKGNHKLKRTIHISFVPDEEIGGLLGMKLFVKSEGFKKLNVGCALDEGIANPDEGFQLFYGERSIWHDFAGHLRLKDDSYSALECRNKPSRAFLKIASFIKFSCLLFLPKCRQDVFIHCTGTPGHGSLLHDDTAGEKVAVVIEKFMGRRAQEKKKLTDNPKLTIGDVTTINLTTLEGGVQTNVVPPEMVVGFDCRLSVDTDHAEFENWINDVCKSAGSGITVEYKMKQEFVKSTVLNRENIWWTTFKAKTDEMGLTLKCNIFPGGTDSRYIRKAGIPALGFSPMNNTPVLLHDHDEFLNEKVFLKGIDIYCKILPALANV